MFFDVAGRFNVKLEPLIVYKKETENKNFKDVIVVANIRVRCTVFGKIKRKTLFSLKFYQNL
jgi:hypothetical protein